MPLQFSSKTMQNLASLKTCSKFEMFLRRLLSSWQLFRLNAQCAINSSQVPGNVFSVQKDRVTTVWLLEITVIMIIEVVRFISIWMMLNLSLCTKVGLLKKIVFTRMTILKDGEETWILKVGRRIRNRFTNFSKRFCILRVLERREIQPTIFLMMEEAEIWLC